jgi:hypothetical protein
MNTFWDFLNSPLFVALLGTVGAITAYVIYLRKIRSYKKDAANILLLEIQNAKRQLAVADKQFKDAVEDETKMLAEDTFLMPNESWNKYKYLFVGNFDRDEWDGLSTFYNKCALFDGAVLHNNKAFPENAAQVRNSIKQAVTTILIEYAVKNPNARSGSQAEKQAIKSAIKAHDLILSQAGLLLSYSPRKPILDAKGQLTAIKELNLDVVTIKLKKIGRIKT